MRTIYFLRHGRTTANELRFYCGSTDLPLTPRGKDAILALKQKGGYPAPDGLSFYTSGMRRTEQTLQLLYGTVPHTALPGFREMRFGSFEMKGYDELQTVPDYRRWISGSNETNCCPGGESGAQMTQRVLMAFAALPEEGDLLLVTHGGPISALMAHLFPSEEKNRYDWQPEPGCGWAVLLDGQHPVSYHAIPVQE